jgi:hypothetical protein
MIVPLTAEEPQLEEPLRKELILADLILMRELMRVTPEPITLVEPTLISAAEAKETIASKKERKVLLQDRIVLLEQIAILTDLIVGPLEATLATVIDLHQAEAVPLAHLDPTAAVVQVVLAAAAEVAPAAQVEAAQVAQAEAAQVEDVND